MKLILFNKFIVLKSMEILFVLIEIVILQTYYIF